MSKRRLLLISLIFVLEMLRTLSNNLFAGQQKRFIFHLTFFEKIMLNNSVNFSTEKQNSKKYEVTQL